MASTLKHHVSRRVSRSNIFFQCVTWFQFLLHIRRFCVPFLQLLELLVQGKPSTSDVVKLASKVDLTKSSDFKIGLCVPTDCLAAYSNSVNFENVKDNLKTDHIFNSVSIFKHQGKTNIFLHLHEEHFIRQVLENNPAKVPLPSCGKRVIVEFR